MNDNSHNALSQFEIKKLIDIYLFGYDISLTNSACYMLLALLCIAGYFIYAIRLKQVIPSKVQMSAELIYCMIADMINKNVGKEAQKFVPLIFSVFIFILLCNLLGMLPYGFTVTSHISITFGLAATLFLFMTLIGIIKHKTRFFSLFLPKGMPLWLAPLIIVIELITYLARPITLSLRLTANMIAGHILLKVVAGFAVSLMILLKVLPIALIVVLMGFEFFVAILQAYIFAILVCVYLHDVINLH